MDGSPYVESQSVVTYGGRGASNKATGYAAADAPGGRETDAERCSALIKALTGREPRIIEKSDGTIELVCGGGASGRLQTLRRACRRHREVARGDGAVTIPPHVQTVSA